MCYCLNRQPRKKLNLDLDIQFSGTDCQVEYGYHSLSLSIVSFFQFFGTKWKLLFMHFHFQWFLQQIKFCSKQASLITKQNKHTLEEFMWRNWYQPSWCISFRVTISFLSQVTWFLLFTLESSGTAAIQRKIFKLFLIVKLLHRHAFMDMDTNMACLDVDNAMNSQSPFSLPGRMWQNWWLQAALMDEIVPCEIMQHNFLFFLFLLYTMTSTSITTTQQRTQHMARSHSYAI